ncbi:MAG: response regulator, partial [Pseudoclavibacter sp.]
MTRVVLVDDHSLVRQGIRGLLGVAGIEVVGEAGDGREGVDVVRRESPDVVLLDVRMPRFDGIWALERMRELDIDVPALMLTTFDDDDLVLEALRAGARGYLL